MFYWEYSLIQPLEPFLPEDQRQPIIFWPPVQFRIITEYVDPNYENVYPDDITKYIEPISWEARFGESYFITITGDKINGYKAVLN